MPTNETELIYQPTEITYTMTSDILEFNMVPPEGFTLQEFNNRLAEIVRNEPDAHNRTTNVKAKMTKWNMTREYPEFKHVSDYTMDILKDFYGKMSNLNMITHLATCWGGLYKRGDHTEPHTHLPGFYNFVYYVKADEGAAPLVFTDANELGVPVTPGYGVLFPSWLKHEVREHQSDEERIFITGNIEATGGVNYPQRTWLET
jgi:hypothetical protein